MSIPVEVQGAIQSHILWKSRLRTAIHTGSCEMESEDIRAIDRCAFGRWIHRLDSQDTITVGVARAAHAHFHEIAAQVWDLAREGRREEARLALAPGGAYEIASSNLIAVLEQWNEAA